MNTFHLMNFIVWIILVHLHHSSNAAAISHECRKDADCSESSFCDQSHFICEICVPCPTLLNRASGIDRCAKSEEDCGRCLNGYQSEDLTGQRRSYKCFPILDKREELPSHPSSLMTWNEFITLVAAIMVLAAMFVVFITYYVKGRQSVPREHLTDGNRKRISSQVDKLPPPYNEVLFCNQTYTFAAVEQSEQLNQATPIGRYHMIHREDDTNPDDLDLNEDSHSDEESRLGSTETIPSSWEPSGTINHLDNVAVLSEQNPRIVRSQSSTTLNVFRESASRSCPNLSSSICTGIHRQRHVLLSKFRRPVSITEPVGKQHDESNRLLLNETPLHPLSHEENEEPQEMNTANDGRILPQSPSEDTTAAQACESTDPIDTLLQFSRRRLHVDESPVKTKRRHVE